MTRPKKTRRPTQGYDQTHHYPSTHHDSHSQLTGRVCLRKSIWTCVVVIYYINISYLDVVLVLVLVVQEEAAGEEAPSGDEMQE